MEINFKGTLSRDEYIKAQKLHNPYKKLGSLLAFLIPLMIIAVFFEFSKDRKMSFLFFILIVFWLYVLFIKKYKIKRYWNQCKSIKEPCSGTVSEKGITIINETSTSNKTWDYYTKYKLSSEMVLLYQSYSATSALPRSFFENDSDWESFVQIVKNSITSKNSQLPSTSVSK